MLLNKIFFSDRDLFSWPRYFFAQTNVLDDETFRNLLIQPILLERLVIE